MRKIPDDELFKGIQRRKTSFLYQEDDCTQQINFQQEQQKRENGKHTKCSERPGNLI